MFMDLGTMHFLNRLMEKKTGLFTMENRSPIFNARNGHHVFSRSHGMQMECRILENQSR
jgi:hypothetical protein